MYIRRKVFSRIENENGEQKLFSTTEYTLQEDGTCKLFSEGKKLSTSDKVDLALMKLTPKKVAEEEADYYGQDEEKAKKAAKKKLKRSVIGTGAGMGIGGAIVGAGYGTKKAAAIGGLAGAAGGAALAYGTEKGTTALINRMKKKANKKGEKFYEKYVDECNVRSGRMSKEDFIDKYGKEKKK